MKAAVIVLLVVLGTFVSNVHSHSWIVCTDYKVENGNQWESSQCKAYPRNWQAHSQPFGVDTGYNHQDYTCKYSMSEGKYNDNFPMATYNAGQKVCLVWPAKNHVADTCTNPYIPDGGTDILISSRDATSDPSKDNWRKIATLGGKGFQNCPKFCENMDKAFCSGCFNVPSDLQPGKYAFQWRWTFNPGTPYTSCWDATVLASGAPNNGATPVPTDPSTKPVNPDPNPTKPLVGNAVRLVNPPKSVKSGSNTITLEVEYSADRTVDIVVDFMRANDYYWFGKAVQENVQSGSGKIKLTVTVDEGRANNLADGQFILKPWIVNAGFGADATKEGWTQELDRKEYQVYVGASPSSANSGARVSLALIAAMLVALLL